MAWYDNLTSGLMPGESYGIPDAQGGFQGQVGGLLSGNNPLFNIGLGILANNNSRNFGQVIGRGLQQGSQLTQQANQTARQNKMTDLQTKRYEQEQKKYDLEQQALADFDTKFPQYKGLAQIDPKSALKIAYPDLAGSSADPYYQFLPTSGGYAAGNARTGKVDMVLDQNGNPIIRSQDDPKLQGTIEENKARAKSAFNISTQLPGQLLTEEQLADMLRGGAPTTYGSPTIPQGQPQLAPQIPPNTPMLPQGAPRGNFNGDPQAIMSQISRIRDPQERASATAAFNQQYGQQPIQAAPMSNSYGGGGVRIPTPAEQAALTEAAKTQAEFDSPQNTQKREQAYKFKTTTGKAVLDTIDDASKRVNNWTAGLGGSTLKGIPASDAYDLNADIETIKSNFGFDRLQAMRDMSPTGGALGGIAVQELTALQASVANLDTAQSPKQLKKNLEKAKGHYQKWLDTLEETKNAQDGKIIPKNEVMPYNGKRSAISGGWSAKRK